MMFPFFIHDGNNTDVIPYTILLTVYLQVCI